MSVVKRQEVEAAGTTYTVEIWRVEAEEKVPGSGSDRAGYPTEEAGQYVAIIRDDEGELGDANGEYALWIAPYAVFHETPEFALGVAVAAITCGVEEND